MLELLRQNTIGIWCEHDTQLYCFYDIPVLALIAAILIVIVIGLVVWCRYHSRKRLAARK